MHAGRAGSASSPRRGLRIFVALGAFVLLCVLAARFLLEPQRVSRFLLARTGASLGLEIGATGQAEYALRGTPTLVLRGVVAREPGASHALLRADRILVSVPWSTIRARGDSLDARRLELDAPVIDLAALQHWLASRPPSPRRLPTFERGLRIRDGVVIGDGWTIDAIAIDLPVLAPTTPLHAGLHAHYRNSSLAASADLAIAIVRPGDLVRPATTGAAIAGHIDVRGADGWHLPVSILLSGPVLLLDGGLRVAPLRAGVAGDWHSGGTDLPFSLGVHGPLSRKAGTWLLADAGVSARGRGDPATDPLPPITARGDIALGQRLVVRLGGTLARWPAAWPALPMPLAASTSPVRFALDYAGSPALRDVATLHARRDAASLDARFHLAEVQAWLAADGATLLPPLDARLQAPVLEIDGARLEGVDATVDAPEVPDAGR